MLAELPQIFVPQVKLEFSYIVFLNSGAPLVLSFIVTLFQSVINDLVIMPHIYQFFCVESQRGGFIH
jgi:hypothetical protein